METPRKWGDYGNHSNQDIYDRCQIKKGGRVMAWIIKAYIPVEPEDPEVYATVEDAEREIKSQRLMQPENVYLIEEVEE